MTEPTVPPKDDHVGEGGDGTDPTLPEDAPLPAEEPEPEEDEPDATA